MDVAVKEVIVALHNEIKEDISSEDQLKQIATISANNDPEVGELIATATINLATIPLVSGLSIPANSTQFIDLEQIIYNGETITASASTTAVDFHIAGYEVY